jgi:hypothetical protein
LKDYIISLTLFIYVNDECKTSNHQQYWYSHKEQPEASVCAREFVLALNAARLSKCHLVLI